MQNTKYYNEFFELGQQKINFSFYELSLPDDDPVYTLKKVMEDIDYSGLLTQYSNKGRNGFNPIMMYAIVVHAAMLSFSTLFDVDFGELNEKNFCLYLMVCSPYLEVKASLKRLKALTSKHGEHEK